MLPALISTLLIELSPLPILSSIEPDAAFIRAPSGEDTPIAAPPKLADANVVWSLKTINAPSCNTSFPSLSTTIEPSSPLSFRRSLSSFSGNTT